MIVVGTREPGTHTFSNATEGSVLIRHDHRECPLQATEGSLKFLPTKQPNFTRLGQDINLVGLLNLCLPIERRDFILSVGLVCNPTRLDVTRLKSQTRNMGKGGRLTYEIANTKTQNKKHQIPVKI